MNRSSTKLSVPAVTIAFGVALTLCWLLISTVHNFVAVSTWQYSVYYLGFYLLLVYSTFWVHFQLANDKTKKLFWLATIVLISFALTFNSNIGLVAILLVITLVTFSAALQKKIGHISEGGQYRESLIAAILVHTSVLTAGIGSLWVYLISPFYAEGFIVLVWLLLATIHIILFSAIYLTDVLLIKNLEVDYVPLKGCKVTRLLILITACLILAFSSMYYSISIEGEPLERLEKQEVWQSTFKPLAKSNLPKNNISHTHRWSKQDIVDYILESESLSISQIATLYLLTDEPEWAFKFKELLLKEAKVLRFTAKTGSIKFSQREAMIRAMYLIEIQKKQRNFLTEPEAELVSNWFEKVTARIFQPEWVDWLYAVPFNDEPDGPYLNQEVGGATIAVLRQFIKAPELRKKIDAFLRNKMAGFENNYRNPDDSLGYQNVWIENAFAAHYFYDNSETSRFGMKLAAKWLLQQLPQHGFPLEYGLPSSHRPFSTLAIAAFYLKDTNAKWLLNLHLSKIKAEGKEIPSELVTFWLWDDAVKAEMPAYPSMILEGPTGYAFRPGPIESDKIILRTHQKKSQTEQFFLLANLRNIGWHRYPATNTVIRLAINGESVVGENIVKKQHKWLPAGRAKHRDKKVDRLRLNGLQIARSGLDALIGHITGVYSFWRQDVPRTSQVLGTQYSDRLQSVTVVLDGWAKTRHTRSYLLLDESTLFVVDSIDSDSPGLEKAVVWHLQGPTEIVDAQTIEGTNYDVVFSDPVYVESLTEETGGESEKAAYDDFQPASRVFIDVSTSESKDVVTAFSTLESNISNLSVARDSESFSITLQFNKKGITHRLLLDQNYHWQRVD